MGRKRFTADEIKENIANIDGWRVEGEWLKKRFEFRNFAESLAFVNKVGEIAEEADHHPDITFGWGYANIDLTTHDVGGLTHNDFDVAGAIDAAE